MKLFRTAGVGASIVASLVFFTAGCSSMSGKKGGEEVSSTAGPSIINARANPSTIELNRSMQASGPAEILAEIKDFNAPVSDVHLRFSNVPVDIKMEHVAGSTWRAGLTPDVLRQLAVGNQTTTYQANIYARNQQGQMGVSKEPVEVAVKAPDLATQTG